MNGLKRHFLLFVGCLALIAISGCGYTTRSFISDKYKNIYIAQFANKIDITRESDAASRFRIYRPMLERDITQALINRFLWDGNLKPKKDERADLILRGELAEFRLDPLRYTDEEEVEEYRINIRVNLSLYDNIENKLLWKETGFTGDTTYFTSESQDAAINEAIKDLVRRIVERTVEVW